jgi:ABC-2 type transport system ATP-binding protein
VTAALDVRGVEKRFGDVVALRGVDLAIAAGEVVGLLGPNGAGKTTLVRTVATLLVPDAGTVEVCGSRDASTIRTNIGLAGQYASVDELLTGRENLELIGRLYGIEARACETRATDLLAAIGLGHAADRRVGTYSGGMRRRLDLGATLIGEPALLLLDEPTAGLDPRSRRDLWDLVDGIAERGAAVLVTSQHIEEVERLAGRVVVLRDGAVIADDVPGALRRRLGGQVLDVRADASDVDAAAAALLGAGLSPRTDVAEARITAAADGGVAVAGVAAHALVAAHIEPTELSLRTPSLEEAFFALTGDARDLEAAAGADDVSAMSLTTRSSARPVVTHSAIRDVAAVTGRYWKHLVRTPQSLFFATVQPILFVLGLQAVFAGLVEQVVGDDYIQFLLPGVIVMNLVLNAGTTGVGLATDLQEGIIDRFRSLPMAHVAVLAGRTTTDLLRSALALVIMVAAGTAIGFRFDGGIVGGAAALAVALLFGYAVTWVFAAVGLAVRDPQAATFLGFAPVLLFVYLSSAWVPVDTMDGAVQAFARNQPVNVTIEAVRGLANGTPVTGEVLQSITWSVVLVGAFASIATRQLRRVTA